MHASLSIKNLQGNYFLRFFSHLSGRLYILGGIFSLMQEILHAWRESERNSVQAGDSLNAGELEALQKLKGKKYNFQTQFVQLQLFFYDKTLAFITTIPPTFPVLMNLPKLL